MSLRKKTPADYRALARKRHFRWLEQEVPNVTTKTWWECQEGHEWEAPYYRIQQGGGCPICAGVKRKEAADYRALAEERGIFWLGPEVPNTLTKTWWECRQGHKWRTRYGHIQQGSGCPICARNSLASNAPRKEAADYQALARKRGFFWPGPKVPNNETKTTWQCACGHRWQACYKDIQQGKGCPVCAGSIPKTPTDYHVLGEKRGYQWLGPMVPNVRTPTEWECQQGHRWQAAYNSIQQGSGCPFCSGKARKTPTDFSALAEKLGILWLGPEVPNNRTKTTWRCKKGHYWRASFHDLQKSAGCPTCIDMVNGARVSQIQRRLVKMLGGVLNYQVGRYKVDVALRIGDTRVAVEYDAWYWHAARQDDDLQRDKELIAAGWRVLRIKSNSSLPNDAQLDLAIAQLLAGKTRVEIVLADWEKGPSRFEIG